jgi:hypothetical protein
MPPQPRGVHEADIARWGNAKHAIGREHDRLVADAGQRVTPAVGRWAYVYGKAVLDADDADGAANGWVTRADHVRWVDVIALGRAAAGQVDPDHDGQDTADCAACDLWRAVARIRESALQAGLGTAPT